MPSRICRRSGPGHILRWLAPIPKGREEASHALRDKNLKNVNGPTMLQCGKIHEYPCKYPTFTM